MCDQWRSGLTAPRALAVPIFSENYEKYAIENFFFLFLKQRGETFLFIFIALLNGREMQKNNFKFFFFGEGGTGVFEDFFAVPMFEVSLRH